MDAVIHQEETYVVIFISNANNSLSAWLLSTSSIVPYSLLDDNPVTGHVFNIKQMNYLAVATRTEKTSSSGFVNIYKISKGNMTKVQSIASRGTSSITSFRTNGVSYLVIANDRAYSSPGHSTYHLTVDIYSYSDQNAFAWFRSIPTYRAYRVSTYQIGSFAYLAVVHYDQSVSFFQFRIELGFEKVDELHVAGVRGLTYVKILDKQYVFLSAAGHTPLGVSKLMEINPTGERFL